MIHALWLGWLMLSCGQAPASEIQLDLDRDDPHVTPEITRDGFRLVANVSGTVQKSQPVTIRIRTKQSGKWSEFQVNTGKFLKAEYDAQQPGEIRLEREMEFDLSEGDRRFQEGREAIAGQLRGKGDEANQIRRNLLLRRIQQLHEENAGLAAPSDKQGRRYTPPLPRLASPSATPEQLEALLQQQCCWPSVAQAFRLTGLAPTSRHAGTFEGAWAAAKEIEQVLNGIGPAGVRFLNEAQVQSLADGLKFELAATFWPWIEQDQTDWLWQTAPGVRLSAQGVTSALLEGMLRRSDNITVAWWRIESERPNEVDINVLHGDGSIHWRWVRSPEPGVRYLRLLLHSPETKYRIHATLKGTDPGEPIIVYDGPATRVKEVF